MATTHRVFLCSASVSNVVSTESVVATHLTTGQLDEFLCECRQCATVYSPEVSYTVKEHYMQSFVVYWKGLPSLDDALITTWKQIWLSRFPAFDECKISSSYLSGIQMSCPRVHLEKRRSVNDDETVCSNGEDTEGRPSACGMGNLQQCFHHARVRRKMRRLVTQLEQKHTEFTALQKQAEDDLIVCQKQLRLAVNNISHDEFPDVIRNRIRLMLVDKKKTEQRLTRVSTLRHRIGSELQHIKDATQLTLVMETFSNVVDYLETNKEKLDVSAVEECMEELQELRMDNTEITAILSQNEDDLEQVSSSDIETELFMSVEAEAIAVLAQTQTSPQQQGDPHSDLGSTLVVDSVTAVQGVPVFPSAPTSASAISY